MSFGPWYLILTLINYIVTAWASVDLTSFSLDGTLQWWPLNGEKTSPQQNTQQQQSLKSQGKWS